jgi:hypothetical protein
MLDIPRGLCGSEDLRATDLLWQSTAIIALKTADGSIIASDTLTLYLTSGRYDDPSYREMLPSECIHQKGRYLLRVELPLPLRSAAATDEELHTIASIRTYLDGKLVHSGPYGHTYWQLTELTPGTHDLEIRITDESFRAVLSGFRRSLSVQEEAPVGAPDGMCDFDNDPEETLVLSAAVLPSQEDIGAALFSKSSTVKLASPIEGDCMCKGAPIQLRMLFPSSVSSGRERERLLLVTVDGSAAMIPLNDSTKPPGCVEVHPDLILNPGQTQEHVMKVFVMTSGWTLLAESLPVMLRGPSADGTCPNRTSSGPDSFCVRLSLPREPSAELVELIQRDLAKPKCGLNSRIDGVWSSNRYIPFFCRIPELNVTAAQACIQNRSIVLAGTSVVRGLFFGLLGQLGAETGIDSKLPVTRQLSSHGKVVSSNWWRRRAEMSVCPKQPSHGGVQQVSGRCRSGCWSCMHTVGEGQIAYVWTHTHANTTLSDRFESITR